MRKHITIGIRVTARRGEFLPKEPGKERQTRAKWYGIVSESVGDNLWVITWDNGQSTREKSTALCIEPSTAGRQPLLPLSPQGQAPRRGSGNDIYEHPDHLAGAAGAVLIIESAPTLSISVASNEDDGTGENPWETFQRHHPQEPSSISPPHPETQEIASEDPDQAEEEDLDVDDSDDDDDDESPDEHARARIDAEIILASKVGAEVSRKCASSGKTALWKVVPATIQPFKLDEPRPSTSFGLVGGLPLLSSGEPDIVTLWLKLYPGDMSSHLAAMNASGLRGNAKHKDITEHEYVRFWGLIIGARQFSEKGKNLWTNSEEPMGLRSAPNYEKHMASWRFETIRRLLRDICPESSVDPWNRFRPMLDEYNANRSEVLHTDGDSTLDESMSAYQPRLDKLGGLPNISFIKRKPKPLGTEFKTICDTETGVMKFMEVQEGKEAMRVKEHSVSHGVTTGCTIRLANACSPGTTILGDSWFGSVKVLPPILFTSIVYGCFLL
jgi:hypothetical protein